MLQTFNILRNIKKANNILLSPGAEDKLRNFQRPNILPSGLFDPELQMMVPFAEICMRGKVRHCRKEDQRVCDQWTKTLQGTFLAWKGGRGSTSSDGTISDGERRRRKGLSIAFAVMRAGYGPS